MHHTVHRGIRCIDRQICVVCHADSRGVKRLAASVCVCVCVCPHDKAKTAETTITKLATERVHRKSSPNQLILGQKVTGSQSVKIVKAIEWPLA